MRVDVKKFLFAGIAEEKARFFEGAQKLGVIEFINTEGSALSDLPSEVNDITQAIKVLRGLSPLDQVEYDSIEKADRIVKEILSLKEQIAKGHETLRVLQLDYSRVAPFGDFSWTLLHEIEAKGNRKVQFFCAKKGVKETLPDHPGLLYVTSDEDLDYFISFSEEPLHYEQMIEMKFDKNAGEIKEEMNRARHSLHEAEAKLRPYAKYSAYLHQALYSYLNRYHLRHAEGLAKMPSEGLFVVEGWIPETKVADVKAFSEKLSVFMEEVAIEEGDRVPTYLENEGWGRVGEDLIGIYDTPADNDKDPSIWVLLAFGLFFAFIVGDGGYGLVYLALCLYLKWKHPALTGFKKRFLNLATFLSVCCVIWGLLIGSFFGVTLGVDNPIRDFSPITYLVEKKAEWIMKWDPTTYKGWIKKYPELQTAANGKALIKAGPQILSTLADGVLLELALFIGVSHLIIGMIRYLRYNWSFLGWILFLIGAYLYFPAYLGGPSLLNYAFGVPLQEGGQLGLQFIYIGITLAVVIAVWRYRLLGLTEVMNLIQVFSDVLSYLRLYALGLAGGIVGGVINDAAAGLPALFAILLALLGHGINMVLGIMGGVIHGLRLNFLEWYHYSFQGGGKKFKALELHENNLD
jgi:V/A-type H+-transporting ATPase subunit I